MVRSIRASKSGLKKASKKFNGKNWTQDYLAGAANCTRQTVSKFFAGVAIDRRFFLRICDELGLEWGEIADLESEIDGGGGRVNTQRGLYLILIYKFPRMNREKIEAMFGLSELKQTRFYQEAKDEGIEEGEHKAKLDAVSGLIELGLTREQIAQVLNLSLAEISEIIQQQNINTKDK